MAVSNPVNSFSIKFAVRQMFRGGNNNQQLAKLDLYTFAPYKGASEWQEVQSGLTTALSDV